MSETGAEFMDKKRITYKSFRKKARVSWRQQKHKFIFMIVLVIMVLAGFGCLHLNSYAQSGEQNTKVVRVGYYACPDFQNGAGDHLAKSGYSYEYLQKIAYYTGWKYEYIYGTRDALYAQLLAGKIDLLAGLAYTDGRAEQIYYPKCEMRNGCGHHRKLQNFFRSVSGCRGSFLFMCCKGEDRPSYRT